MTVTTRAPGDKVTAAIFNGKVEAPILTAEINDLAVTSPKLAVGAVTALKIARQPGCILRRTTAQSGIVSGVSTTLLWDSAAVNADNNWVIGTPGVVTINTAGVYYLSFNVGFSSGATGVRQAGLVLNGTTTILLDLRPTAGGSNTSMVGAGRFYPLSATDQLALVVFHDNGSNIDIVSVGDALPQLTVVRFET